MAKATFLLLVLFIPLLLCIYTTIFTLHTFFFYLCYYIFYSCYFIFYSYYVIYFLFMLLDTTFLFKLLFYSYNYFFCYFYHRSILLRGNFHNFFSLRCPDEVVKHLTRTKENKIDSWGILATRLCTHKENVDQINKVQLRSLPGKTMSFQAIDSDINFSKTLDLCCPAKAKLELKVGAQVCTYFLVAINEWLSYTRKFSLLRDYGLVLLKHIRHHAFHNGERHAGISLLSWLYPDCTFRCFEIL